MDTGPSVVQVEEPIHNDDTIVKLYQRIEQLAIQLVENTLPLSAKRNVRLHFQDKEKQRIMPQRAPEDGQLDLNWDSVFFSRCVRAQERTYPGGFSDYDGFSLTSMARLPIEEKSTYVHSGFLFHSAQKTFEVICSLGAPELLDCSFESSIDVISHNKLIELHAKPSEEVSA